MTFSRRNFLHAGVGGLMGGVGTLAAAQTRTWPRNPVRFVVPLAPGGGADVSARMLAEQLRRIWGGVGAVVDNKTGGNTIIAAESVLNSPRDGSNFLVTISLTMQLPYLMQKVPFDPIKDFVPVGAITVEQLVLVVSPTKNVKTLPDLLKLAKAQPSAFPFGSFGIGSNSHLAMIEIAKASGADLVHVPYRGAALAVQAVLAGEVAFALSNLGSVRQHIAAGKLIPIAVTGEQRYRFVPEVPTFAELGIKGFETPAWIGVFAANGVPGPVIQQLGQDMRTALQAPELVAKIQDFSQEPGQMSVKEFQALVKRDNDNAGPMIRAAGIRLD